MMIETFHSVMQRLESEGIGGKHIEHLDAPSHLPFDQINVAEEVFQPRDMAEDISSKESHVKTLVEAIYNEKAHLLDPITVWWSGARWYVIDGHHRMKAYSIVRDQRKVSVHCIPVCPFFGSITDAIFQATSMNTRDKLPMTKDDKRNRAWQLVALEKELSKSQVAGICGVGTATVSRMRKILSVVKDLYSSGWQEAALNMSWKEAQRIGKEPVEYDNAWEEAQSREWAGRLTKSFGNVAKRQPDVFWRSLEIYSPRLVRDIKEMLMPNLLSEIYGNGYIVDGPEPNPYVEDF